MLRRPIIHDIVDAADAAVIQRGHGCAHRIIEMDDGQLTVIAADDRQAPALNHPHHAHVDGFPGP